jgi:hypothetical protein
MNQLDDVGRGPARLGALGAPGSYERSRLTCPQMALTQAQHDPANGAGKTKSLNLWSKIGADPGLALVSSDPSPRPICLRHMADIGLSDFVQDLYLKRYAPN